MSGSKEFGASTAPRYTDTEAIGTVGALNQVEPNARDGAIRKHYNMMDRARLLRHTRQVIGGVALAASIVAANYYSKDVMPERARLEHAHSSVTFSEESLDPGESARSTISFTGWGTMNAKNVVTSLPYETIGKEAYFSYDPAGISHKKNAEAVMEYATENNVDRLVLHGSSMGGNMALKTAALLHESDAAPAVEAIILDCTPLSADAVWPERRLAGDRMLRLTSIIPGAENSRMILGSAMMIDRNEQYRDGMDIDWQAAFKTAKGVRNRIVSGRDASIELRNAQLRVILSEGTEGDLKTLSQERNGKKSPHIFLLVPADVKSDATVDNEKSAEILVNLGKKYGIDVSVISLPPGTGHANPAQRPEQYSATLTNQVFPIIESDRQETQLAKYVGKRDQDKENVLSSDDALAEVKIEQQLADASTPTG